MKLASEVPVDSGKRDWRVRTVGGNGKVDACISNTANYNVFVEPFMAAKQKISGQEVRPTPIWYDGNGRNLTGALPNAPVAGRWFQAQFVQLVENAFPEF